MESRAAAPVPAASSRTRLLVAAKIGVSLLCLGILFASIDLSRAARALGALSAGPLAAAIALHVVIVLSAAWRWRMVLAALGDAPPSGALIRYTYIGAFFNQLLPTAMGGDVVRVWLVRRFGLSLRAAVDGVLVERLLGMAGIGVLTAGALLWLAPRVDNAAALWTLIAAAAAAIGAALVPLAFAPLRAERAPAWLRPVVVLAGDVARVVRDLPRLAAITALSVAGHALSAVIAWVIAVDMGLDLGLGDCLLLVPPMVLATMIPVSLAGWGVREGAAVLLFGLVGVPAAAAVTLSVVFGLCQIAAALPGGLLWLRRTRDPAP